MKTKDKVKKSGSWVALPFAPFSCARLLVIPAKPGIQYVRRSTPKACRLDSRLRGNDVWPGAPVWFQ